MTLELFEVMREVKRCERCPLHKYRRSPVFGEGNDTASIMLVGEAPGKKEDETGRPFVGAAGKYLTNALWELGIDRVEVYITNAVKCRPPQNRKPTKKEIEACRPYLLKQIEIIKPQVIICLGSSAAYSLLGREIRLREAAGMLLTCNGRKIMITYHPSFVMRFRRKYEQEFIKHLRYAILSRYFKNLDGKRLS